MRPGPAANELLTLACACSPLIKPLYVNGLRVEEGLALAISNLLNLGQNVRQLTCSFDNTYGAQFQGVIALVLDYQFLKINNYNAESIWQTIATKSGSDTGIQGGSSLSIVYISRSLRTIPNGTPILARLLVI